MIYSLWWLQLHIYYNTHVVQFIILIVSQSCENISVQSYKYIICYIIFVKYTSQSNILTVDWASLNFRTTVFLV